MIELYTRNFCRTEFARTHRSHNAIYNDECICLYIYSFVTVNCIRARARLSDQQTTYTHTRTNAHANPPVYPQHTHAHTPTPSRAVITMMLVARPLRAVLSFTTNQRHNQHFVTTASAAATRSPPPATLPRAARSTYAPVHGLWIDGVLPSSGGAAVPTTTCSRRPFSSWSSVVRLQVRKVYIKLQQGW